jgi:hypothetical protein
VSAPCWSAAVRGLSVDRRINVVRRQPSDSRLQREEDEHERLLEFLRQQKADADFKARLWGIVKRWAAALVAVGLGVTTGWNILERVLKLWAD